MACAAMISSSVLCRKEVWQHTSRPLDLLSDWEIERPPKRVAKTTKRGRIDLECCTNTTLNTAEAETELEELFTHSQVLHLVLLVGIDCVKIRTLVASLHRAGSSKTVRLVQLIEVHKGEIASVIPRVNGDELACVTVIPADLITISNKQLESRTHHHCAQFLRDRMGNDSYGCLEVFIFLALHVLTSSLGGIRTECATNCLSAVPLFQLDPHFAHVWSSYKQILVGRVVSSEGDASDRVETEILGPLINECTGMSLVLVHRSLTCDIKVSSETLTTERIELEVQRSKECRATMSEFALRCACTSIEAIHRVLVVRSHEDGLSEVLDSTRRTRDIDKRGLLQNAVRCVVQNDAVGAFAGYVQLVAIIPACVLCAAVVVMTEVKAPWPLQATAAFLDEVSAGTVVKALHNTVLGVVACVDCAVVQQRIVDNHGG